MIYAVASELQLASLATVTEDGKPWIQYAGVAEVWEPA